MDSSIIPELTSEIDLSMLADTQRKHPSGVDRPANADLPIRFRYQIRHRRALGEPIKQTHDDSCCKVYGATRDRNRSFAVPVGFAAFIRYAAQRSLNSREPI
jgi:hypothetical protein